jgi:hypothetical protein
MSKYPVNKNQLSNGKKNIYFIIIHTPILYNIEKKINESALQKLLQKQTQKQPQTNVPDDEQLNKGKDRANILAQ